MNRIDLIVWPWFWWCVRRSTRPRVVLAIALPILSVLVAQMVLMFYLLRAGSVAYFILSMAIITTCYVASIAVKRSIGRLVTALRQRYGYEEEN